MGYKYVQFYNTCICFFVLEIPLQWVQYFLHLCRALIYLKKKKKQKKKKGRRKKKHCKKREIQREVCMGEKGRPIWFFDSNVFL